MNFNLIIEKSSKQFATFYFSLFYLQVGIEICDPIFDYALSNYLSNKNRKLYKYRISF